MRKIVPKVKKSPNSKKISSDSDNQHYVPSVKAGKNVKKIISDSDSHSLFRNMKEEKRLSDRISNVLKSKIHLDLSYIDRAVAQSKNWLKKNHLYVPYPMAVTFDYHVPHTSRKWIEKLLFVSERRKINRLVIGGDFFDQMAFMFWLGVQPVNWETECEAGTQLMSELLRSFDFIYICLGNHDLRLWKKLNQRFDAKFLFKEILDEAIIGRKVFISELEYIESQDEKWLICHPGNYSIRGATVPTDIAEIEMKNVIGGHGHHLGATKTKSGQFWGVDGGGMFDQEAFTYDGNVRKTKHPKMNNGFVILNGSGELRMYGDGLEM